ncbi:MAG TPA: DUF1330 domain-containing protein [Steroidobacteraceae bacterium]|nr:DUF1330 domain-containing protein [Steroidobacteraceae bacterium]
MSAYIIAQIEITDPERYAEYVKQVPATIARFGGRYLARGGKSEALEGRLTGRRIAIVEFESYERAKDWYESEDYRGPRALRQGASISSLVLVDGIPSQ